MAIPVTGMEPTSDEELQLIMLISEVEILQSQLRDVGRPVNENIEQMFLKVLNPTVASTNQDVEIQEGSFATNG